MSEPVPILTLSGHIVRRVPNEVVQGAKLVGHVAQFHGHLRSIRKLDEPVNGARGKRCYWAEEALP